MMKLRSESPAHAEQLFQVGHIMRSLENLEALVRHLRSKVSWNLAERIFRCAHL